MKIGILTSGGDCPGINATIRGVCKTAINHYGMEVYGIHSGFRGLLDNDVEPLTEKSLSGLLNLGGTILGTSREKPFKKRLSAASEDKPALMLKNIHDLGLDCIVCIGGNGTQKTAAKLAQAGVNVVSVPKTIDNDVWGTDVSFGFDSAVTIATDAIDRLHSTASSHQRVMVIEVMGHKAGWIALYSGMAGGGDVILIPELSYDIHNIGNTIIERLKKGKPIDLSSYLYRFIIYLQSGNHDRFGSGKRFNVIGVKISKIFIISPKQDILPMQDRTVTARNVIIIKQMLMTAITGNT